MSNFFKRVWGLLKTPVTKVPIWLYLLLEIVVPIAALLLVLKLFK